MELEFNVQGMKIKVVAGFFAVAEEEEVAVILIATTACYC